MWLSGRNNRGWNVPQGLTERSAWVNGAGARGAGTEPACHHVTPNLRPHVQRGRGHRLNLPLIRPPVSSASPETLPCLRYRRAAVIDRRRGPDAALAALGFTGLHADAVKELMPDASASPFGLGFGPRVGQGGM